MKNSIRFPHLLKSRLLNDLPEDQKVAFLNQCAVRFFEESTQVFTQGEKPQGMVMIAHGTVEVSFVSDEGHRSIIHHSGPGETLGDAEAIADRGCAASCTALANTTLLFCATPLLFEHLKSPVFIRNFANVFCSRLERDNAFKSVDQFLPVDQRIFSYLAQLSRKKRIISQSQAYLANVVGCSRQTVNRTLGALRDDGVIELRKGVIEVVDHEALERRVHDGNRSELIN